MADKISLFKRSNGMYYVRRRGSDGVDKWISTGKKNKREALAAMQQGLEQEPTETHDDLAHLATLVYAYVTANHAPRTLEVYAAALEAFTAVVGNRHISGITRADVDRFKSLRLAVLSPVSVNMQLRTLRAAFGMAVRWDMLRTNPFTGVQLVRIPDHPPAYLSFMQWDDLIAVLRGHWLEDLVTFALCTGMRQGEILHLEWRHVNIDKRTVHVTSTETFRTKAGKRRIVPLNEKALAALTRQPRGHELVFTHGGRPIRRDTLTHAFKRAARAARLPEAIHFHSLRHTFASWLVQDGVSIIQVGRLLGHTNTRTTEIYAHLQPETMHDVVDRIRL